MIKCPLSYYGSKNRLSGWIIGHFPEHHTFVDVFGGSGTITLRKDVAPVEVYNDLDEGLVNFYRVLQDCNKFEQFHRRVSLTLYSYSEYEWAYDVLSGEVRESDVEWAVAYFVFNRFVFGGRMTTSGWAKNITETSASFGIAKRVKDWVGAVGGLERFVARFMMVQVECRDFEYVLKSYDTVDTLFYCDPPYYNVGDDAYTIKFCAEDHERLLERLIELDGMCVLSGYDNDLYCDVLERQAGWWYVSKSTTIGAHDKQGKLDSRVESLWINPQAEKRLPASVRNKLERVE